MRSNYILFAKTNYYVVNLTIFNIFFMIKGRTIKTPKLIVPKKRAPASSIMMSPTPLIKQKSTPTINVAPIIDPEVKEIEIKYSSHKNTCEGDIEIYMSPPFADVPPKDWRKVFKNKCTECSKICDFSNPSKDLEAKNNKTILLKQIISSFSIPHISRGLSSDTVQIFYQMCAANIFRDFPAVKVINLHDGSTTNIQDAAWAHISIVYEAMLAIININSASDFPPNFLQRLINNIISNDCRERHFVGTVLNGISNRFPIHRSTLKKKTLDLLSSGRCSSALIDWTIALMSGMSSPLKADNLDVFHKTILPLHRLPDLQQFWKPLMSIVSLFISKDEELLDYSIMYLLKHWPVQDTSKQSAMLDEMENWALNFATKKHNKVLLTFFKHVTSCITDENSTLSERAIKLVTNKGFATIIKDHTNGIIFAIVSGLSDAINNHWDHELSDKASVALKLLETYDPQNCKKALDAQKLLKSRKRAQMGICKNNWQKVYEKVRSIDPNISQLVIPNML